MTRSSNRLHWIRGYFGRDWRRGRGTIALLQLIAREDLMTRGSDEGRMTLVGLELQMQTRPFRLTARSDAREIAERLVA